MRLLLAALLLFAPPFWGPPFWEAKVPDRWTDREIDDLRHDSPWAQTLGPDPKVLVYLATAAPIEDAEQEARLRSKNPLREPDAEYVDYLRENRGRYFVLASPEITTAGLSKPGELKAMEEQTVMTVAAKQYKIIGHFPPSKEDPVFRLVFPREVQATSKSVVFHLYLPGISFPERQVEFRVKDLMYHGQLAM